MADFLKETPAGQFLRLIGCRSANLLYPEEKPGFEPAAAGLPIVCERAPSPAESDLEKTLSKLSATVRASEKCETSPNPDNEAIIVSWTEHDPGNPRNWSQAKKTWTLVVVNLYTFCVYCTASIITPTAEAIQQRYHISILVASMGLSLYVVGYGLGPMFLSPISEIPRVGRNPPYLYSFVAFLVVSIALAFVDNFPAIIVLRWLQGLFGSPALASGAASIEDIYDIYSAPYGYVWWIAAMYCGPAVGPLMAGYAAPRDWRWPLYEVIIMSGVILFLLPFLPETYPGAILLNRAKRLRKATGDDRYRAQSELHPIPFKTVLWEALVRPLEITMKDPAVLYAALYGGLVYATYYSFFEAFPLVYLGTYQMSLGQLGLIFLGLMTGCIVGLTCYYVYLRRWFIPRARKYHAEKGKPVEQEQWLRPGMAGVWGPPIGLLLFAWTARADVHWIAPTIGINIWAAGSFCMFQSIICYIALAYPKYVASLFAANDFVRSMMAAAFVQFSRPMYVNLGVDKGVTVIAGLSGVGVAGMYGLYYFGGFLRAKSKFTS
ncbi:uncharacterized protein A1O5_12641 [Cladophialophora psammophila CBS 110553]|uniref:Major facilitator superfamily (MFS) profile domain-containing protein n=1 Tax=Cladophialophora psammophila CBS 110553 TaxID=1182543 RepID=W9WCY0_9EURO|nr:uncharacterized protein A1O5_12641 [Cladophialophora psammophila CBS 110553]EXJ56374.1 hypothetical protein A1O5_12641 [Cladophialophora psammophila CBS 110553]